MGMRVRKLIGTIILVFGLTAYVLAASVVATTLLGTLVWAHLLFYAVAGVAWALPTGYLIRWMNRPGVDEAMD